MKIFVFLICASAIFFGTISSFALEIVPNPEETDLGEGKVFWLTLPEDDEYWMYSGYDASDFPGSGLYQDGELLYSVDVDSGWWWMSLYFSDDAMTFLRVPSSGGSIVFYEKGVIKHEYDVLSFLEGGEGALVQPRAGTLETSPSWDFPEKRYYDRENNILRLTTVEDSIITFDLSSGALLSEEENIQRNYIFIPLCVSGTVIFVIFLLHKMTRKRSK